MRIENSYLSHQRNPNKKCAKLHKNDTNSGLGDPINTEESMRFLLFVSSVWLYIFTKFF